MTSLLNFDQVVALSQQTINTQFQLLFANGTISKTLKVFPFTNQKIGIEATLKSPSVSMTLDDGSINQQQVRFNINIATGTAAYFSPDGQTVDEKIDGYVIALIVNLTELTVDSNFTGLVVSDEAKQKTASYLDQSLYEVSAILLDLANVNFSSAIIYDNTGKKNQDSSLTTLLSEIIKELIKDGNPYLISINPKQKTISNTGLDGFKPTGVMYNTHLYNNLNSDSILSTYNMLIMNEEHALPWTNVTLPKFSQNLLDTSDTYGRLFISNAQFKSVYIEGLVIPVLKSAMGGNTDFKEDKGTWTYEYDTNQDNEHDGHGPVVGKDSGILDIYADRKTKDNCVLTFDPSKATANSIVLEGSGSFYIKTDYYEKPFGAWAHDAWNKAEKKFTFSITFEAGADGKITIAFASNSKDATTDTWENFVVKFADLFKGGLQKSLDDANDAYSTFESGQFTNFTDNAKEAFNVLEETVILPAASSYFFKNATADSDGNIHFDLTPKN